MGDFLLRHRAGYCQHFAAALALMCQYSGIPARVVNGYRVGPAEAVGRFYLVRQKHAHSWVEVYLPGRDWVVFDPTPAGEQQSGLARAWWQGLTTYWDYVQFQWAHRVVSYDSDARSSLLGRFQAWLQRPTRDEETIIGAIWAFVRELFGRRLTLTSGERLIYWVFALLVLALVILTGYVVWALSSSLVVRVARARTARAVLDHRGREAAFYEKFCRRLEGLGLRRRVGQTPAEFARSLADSIQLMSEAPELIGAYYEVAFGGRRLPEPRKARIEAFLERLRHADRTRLTPATSEARG